MRGEPGDIVRLVEQRPLIVGDYVRWPEPPAPAEDDTEEEEP